MNTVPTIFIYWSHLVLPNRSQEFESSSSGVGKSVPAIFQSNHATGKETELNKRRRTQEKVIDFSRYKYSVTKKKKLPCLQKVSWFRKPHLFTKFGNWEQTSSLIAFATNGN